MLTLFVLAAAASKLALSACVRFARQLMPIAVANLVDSVSFNLRNWNKPRCNPEFVALLERKLNEAQSCGRNLHLENINLHQLNIHIIRQNDRLCWENSKLRAEVAAATADVQRLIDDGGKPHE